MSEDDRKKSWREIDLARDRGGRVEKAQNPKLTRENKKAVAQAKKNLEALFSGGKLSKEKAAQKKAIESSRGSPTFSEGLSRYVEEHGYPRELDMMMLCLDHRNGEFVVRFLNELVSIAPRLNLSEQDLLHAKLKSLALSTFDAAIVDAIGAVNKALLRS